MSLNDATKEAIKTAISEDNLPRPGRRNQTTLWLKENPGRSSYVLLARGDGTLTKACEFYYGESPSQPQPTSQFDYNTPLMEKGGQMIT